MSRSQYSAETAKPPQTTRFIPLLAPKRNCFRGIVNAFWEFGATHFMASDPFPFLRKSRWNPNSRRGNQKLCLVNGPRNSISRPTPM